MTYSVTAGGTRLFCEDWGDGRRLVAVLVRGAEPGLGEECLDEGRARYWTAGARRLMPGPRR
jgi:hypothetical protein